MGLIILLSLLMTGISFGERGYDLDEFDDLFSRAVVKPKKKEEKKDKKPSKAAVAKILDSKRSQNIGILVKSTHLDIAMIEDVVYNCDNGNLDYETLAQIKDMAATSDELTKLKAHVEVHIVKSLRKVF